MTEQRVRFAPAPSGFMHIGNVSAVIINYLYALEHKGSLILRIEDTDAERVNQTYVEKLYTDLNWLGIKFTEGPHNSSSFGPYFQSQRTDLYKDFLNVCIEKGLVYRSFATEEEIESLFSKQKENSEPPRYKKHHFKITEEKEREYLLEKKPFVYRFEIKPITISFNDKTHGIMNFDLSHFSDPIVVRSDGSFTFLFANFVDDVLMKINYVIRGEDHISNSAIQVFMYNALNLTVPKFYHLPLIVDNEGKKLSKRNFGFSLNDLMEAGFLKEAIINYILLMGHSLKEEIFTIEEAASMNLFEKIHSKGTIRYDYEKLLWINTEWIKKISNEHFLIGLKEYISNHGLDYISFVEKNETICLQLKNEIKTFSDIKELVKPFFDTIVLQDTLNETEKNILKAIKASSYTELTEKIKQYSREYNSSSKELYPIIRKVLTGTEKGVSLKLLFEQINSSILEKRYLHALTH